MQSGGGGRGGAPNIKKATFDTTKKKEVGVSDLTLISKVSNEAINDNLKKRFEAAEIYVRIAAPAYPELRLLREHSVLIFCPDVYWTCACFGQPIPRL